MKRLQLFQNFNLGEFLQQKILMVKQVSPHYPYVDGHRVEESDGVRLELTIAKDNTDYGDGQKGLNLFESFVVKISGVALIEAERKFHQGDVVRIQKYRKASVFGDFHNRLSVTCSSIDDLSVSK